MRFDAEYKGPLWRALGLHALLFILLIWESHSKPHSMTMEAQNTQVPLTAQPEIVKAYSVDSQAVDTLVDQLKEERQQEQNKKIAQQQALEKQLAQTKQARVQEQQALAKLKAEEDAIAIKRKKELEEEKKHLKELAEQKALEAKHIKELQKQKEALQKQQQEEAKKLAKLNEQKKAAKAAAEKKLKQAKEAKLAADKTKAKIAAKASAEAAAKARAEAAAKAAAVQSAAQSAQLATEVDKYKALIVNAIGRHWIIPENADTSLSSQFNIRLAPDGMVLEVTLVRSSGDPLLDRSAQTAIYKASPLPVPTDPATFNVFRQISLTVRPEQIRG